MVHLAIIKNVNLDPVIDVYPFIPQPIITQSIIMASYIPVFAGVGEGLIKGIRSVMLGTNAELQSAIGVVVNAPITNGLIKALYNALDIPVVVTIVNDDTNIQERIDAGANAIIWTPPSATELFKDVMSSYRENLDAH